ncbi:MAG: exopolysaccharide biosynthesis polyprenyl glycosylphosphotransferase [Candidatus Eremiobacteraeota bacterium]|nr:exopolysaccharide biosynthesis polyprenyl glycosylphosphotransferase [Candidatus Eremiobacteraeota bacterium]
MGSIVTRNPFVRRQYLLVAVDTVIILASIIFMYLPWFRFSWADLFAGLARGLWIPVAIAVLAHLAVFYVFDLYNVRSVSLSQGRLVRIILAVLLAVGGLTMLFYFFQKVPNLRKVLVTHIPLIIIAIYAWRLIFYRTVMKAQVRTVVMLLGDDALNWALVKAIRDDPMMEYRTAALIPDTSGAQALCWKDTDGEALMMGPCNDIEEVMKEWDINVVVFSLKALPLFRAKLLFLKSRGVQVFDALTFYSLITGRIPVVSTEDSTVAVLAERFPLPAYYLNVKRLVDVCLSLFGIIISFPFVALSAILIAIESPGPLFFRPERVGQFGRTLRLFKLRTMRHTAKKGPLFTQPGDERVTRTGWLIRKFGFDEFPQLFNVLWGDLSLIGPRPIEEVFVDKYAAMTPLYYLRLSVKPGISGWAQVNQVEYPNSDESQLVKLEYDLFYVSHVSLFLDVIIILKTLKKFFHLGYDSREGKAPALL